MPTLDAIASAGPWAVLVFCLIAGFVGLFGAVIKGVVVPGWLFRERTAERDSARVENAQLRATVSKLTARLVRERPQRSSDPPDA